MKTIPLEQGVEEEGVGEKDTLSTQRDRGGIPHSEDVLWERGAVQDSSLSRRRGVHKVIH
jgi:hypothetical protein